MDLTKWKRFHGRNPLSGRKQKLHNSLFFRFCIYESGDFRERKLNKNEKPLNVQSHWSNGGPYQRFVLRRATRSVSNQVEKIINYFFHKKTFP